MAGGLGVAATALLLLSSAYLVCKNDEKWDFETLFKVRYHISEFPFGEALGTNTPPKTAVACPAATISNCPRPKKIQPHIIFLYLLRRTTYIISPLLVFA